MEVTRFKPSENLIPFIKEYIIIKSDVATESKTLPDTGLVMTFRFHGNVLKVNNRIQEAIPVSAVAGLRREARNFYYESNTANFLVIFNVGGFRAFTMMSANDLFGKSISNENFFTASELNRITERLAEAKSDRERVHSINKLLTSKLIRTERDTMITHAIQKIKSSGGLIRITELAGALNISQDPFEKRFRASVGSSPKQYASIIRLRRIIENFSPDISLTEAAINAGYFDQSHFNKDFRQFTGQTPRDFFKSSDFW